jgi:hypothetical protein
MLHKIYPPGVPNQPQNVFKLVFLSEAFTASDKKSFYDACQYFVEVFLKTPPFHLTNINPYWINIYAGFQESNQSGSANGSATAGRTVFESFHNTAEQSLELNQSRINTVLDDAASTFPLLNESIPFSDFSVKGSIQTGQFATLVVVLVPEISGEPHTYSTENTPAEDDYAFVATTVNNHWEQVVYRSIANRLGLGDEYEKSGDEYLSPPDGANNASKFNLQYMESPSATELPVNLKWREYFSVAQKIAAPNIHLRTVDPSVPDNTINSVPVSTSKPEFWEGGGGYRTGMFRPAKDCLMRRKIGSSDLPVASDRVPFCFVCKNYLKSLIE